MEAYVSIPTGNSNAYTSQMWGSEGNQYNAKIGYLQNRKPRWEQISIKYKDIAALNKFGIDPTRPPGGGIIMQANSYGYPLDGYTTGYTYKLPPPADFEVASRVPLSFNQPAIIEASDGTSAVPAIPSDDPVQFVNLWRYGDPEQQATVDRVRRLQHEARDKKMATVRKSAASGYTDSARLPNPEPAPMRVRNERPV